MRFGLGPARPKGVAWLAMLVFALGACGTARAALTLDEWRRVATETRQLAENDAPRAYQQAKQLQASLPLEATPADRARALNLLARVEAYLALTDAAADHAAEAFDIASRNGDRVGQAEADLTVVLNAINQGRMDAMIAATHRSLAVLEGVVDRPDLLSEALLRTAVMYRRIEQFDESVAIAVQAMEIARRSNHPLALTYAHHGLAIAFDQSARYTETREHYTQMLLQARAARSKLLEGLAKAGLASAAAGSGDLPGGERLTREAIALYREMGAPFAINFGLYGLAENLRLQGRHSEAIGLLNEVLARYAKYPNPIGLWFSLNGRSANLQALGQVAAADADAERAYEVAKALGHAIYVSGSAVRLAEIAAARGDHKRAYALSREASEMTNRAAREKAGVRMLQLTQRYEEESRQRQISQLTRRNELQTAEIRQRALQQRWLWSVLGLSVVALAGSGFLLLRLRRSQNAIRVLNASLEQRVHAGTAELRQQARYLRTLIDTLPLLVWLKDTHSRYLAVNQATAASAGRTVEAMVGKTDDEVWPADLAQIYRADDEHVMRVRQPMTAQEALADVNGTIWIETDKAAVLDDDGTVLGTVGVARNISERKAVEAAREAALAEAERLARQRSEFLAQMSHELRTPLNGILGFAQILQRDKPLTERQARGLGIIHESGQHLLTLINDILDLARIDAAKLELFPTDVNLAAFVGVVGDIVRVKAEEKSLLFSQLMGPDLPTTIRVDEKRLRQVLLNLLSNAVKFTDSGRVALRVQAVPMRGLPLRPPPGVTSIARLRFEVEDSGIGMSDEQAARLFQPFEQVGDGMRREGGSGLGLAISRQLVRLMGGDILLRSQPGRGSLFWFELELPVSELRVDAVASRGTPIGYEGARRKVLVVDDVPQNRAVLLDGLGLLGFEMCDAADGEEALERLAVFQPDLVVMDVMMPVLDGLEATRRIRAMPAFARLPVIVASASATRDVEAASHKAGADAFVAKPVENEVLLSAVGRLLGLQWRYEEVAPPAEVSVGEGLAGLELPPDHEMDELYRLARTGNMRLISEQADYLEGLDPRYAALAQRLRNLADGCQSKAILGLVEQFRARPNNRATIG
jgi:PAS domain S-box-containing protein